MSAMVAISNTNNNVNNNNNNNNDNNNNININHDSANFAQMGMVNMMSRKRRKRFSGTEKLIFSKERSKLLYFACQLEARRKKMNSPMNLGLKLIK